MEFPTQGNRYTWSDKLEETRIFFKIRLDIHQHRMIYTMPSFKALFLPEGISDHYPVKVVLNEEYETSKAFLICNISTKTQRF